MHADRDVEQPGHGSGGTGALDPREAGADEPVHQDVRGPAGRRDEAQAEAEVVRGGFRAQQGERGRAREQGAAQVDPAAGGGESDGERAEEFERDGQAQPDPAYGRVQGQVHGGEDERQQQHRPPLRPGEPSRVRTSGSAEDDRGHPLAHGHHARGSDGREGEGTDGSAGLVRRSAGQHHHDAGQVGRARRRLGGRRAGWRGGRHTGRMRRPDGCT